ncbi:CIC11C00000003518 [Sungouiella intermedia]|uniref:CIC11C00000003518 n=1 Tax=Sungouiella intermedia TaxID=45354 RepID=A0A1L0GIC5_9ASCO|nr:CIC11C00000003518 [[Candida] intermedia]
MSSPLSATMSLDELTQVVPQPFELPSDHVSPPPKKHPTFLTKLIKVLTQIQKYSSYTFLGFFGLHIASTVVVPGLGINAEKCQDIFEMCRNVYLGPLVEYLAIYAAGGIHLASGICIRVLRLFSSRTRAQPKDFLIKDEYREDIGLGGLGTLLGLGYKRSWISSTFPSFTPLTFSGYVMAVCLGFHWFKMRLAPMLVDGDSSLVTLKYVTHYLHQSPFGKWGAFCNYAMLVLLLWVSFYHIVSGLFKWRRQVRARAKKIAYGVIGTFTSLSVIAILRMNLWPLDTGFMGKQFAKYLFVEA